jgi:two-component system heavy metal sensor histidine kinase CusS
MSSKSAPSPTPRPRAWSLAARLTLWYAGSSFVLIAASTGFLYWSLTRQLESEDDQFMTEKVRIVRALLRGRADGPVVLPPGGGWGEEAGGSAASFYLRVLDADGAVLVTTAGMDAALPATLFPAPQETEPTRGRELQLPDGRWFRVASVRAPAGEAEGAAHIIQVAMDRTQEEALLAAYRRNLAAVLALGLLVSAALGYRIARRGIRPLEAITATAGRIRSSTLDERIDPAGLPGELRALADTFNAMLDRLEQSFARLRQFSGDIAHELRTPVNNMRGEIEVALSKLRTVEEYREVLGSSLEECGRLAGMVDSLLFLARAEDPRTPVVRERFDVAGELARVREFYEAAAAEAGVRLAVEVEGEVTANLSRPLFQRAVANLVANALAHTPAGGAVTLTASHDNGATRVEVADTGCGIPAGHLAHVFERFYRVDAARSRDERRGGAAGDASAGAGLGLAIVRGIVELHGGTAEIASEPGRGTRVVLTFRERERGGLPA